MWEDNITFDMYIPGSSGEVPNGTQKWSDPPIILSPNGPPSLYNVTSWNDEKNALKICYKSNCHLKATWANLTYKQ